MESAERVGIVSRYIEYTAIQSRRGAEDTQLPEELERGYGNLGDLGRDGPAESALWHAAKAALVRDFAERVLQGEVPRPVATADSLAHWRAARLLTPKELESFERGDDVEPLPHANEEQRQHPTEPLQRTNAARTALDALGIGHRRNETTGDVEHSGTVMISNERGRIAWRLDGDWRPVRDLLRPV